MFKNIIHLAFIVFIGANAANAFAEDYALNSELYPLIACPSTLQHSEAYGDAKCYSLIIETHEGTQLWENKYSLSLYLKNVFFVEYNDKAYTQITYLDGSTEDISSDIYHYPGTANGSVDIQMSESKKLVSSVTSIIFAIYGQPGKTNFIASGSGSSGNVIGLIYSSTSKKRGSVLKLFAYTDRIHNELSISRPTFLMVSDGAIKMPAPPFFPGKF